MPLTVRKAIGPDRATFQIADIFVPDTLRIVLISPVAVEVTRTNEARKVPRLAHVPARISTE